MIVENMSLEEICHEYDTIHEHCFPKLKDRLADGQRESNKIRRFMLRHKNCSNVILKPLTLKIKDHTTFYGVPIIPDYSFFKKKGPSVITFMTYYNLHGLMAVARGGNYDNEYIFATKHFFDRFVARCLKAETDESEVLCQFFANNSNLVMMPHPTMRQLNNIIGVTEEVVFFAERITDKITLMKTCITREMLFDSQKHKAESLDDDIDIIIADRDIFKKQLMNTPVSRFNRYNYF